MWCSARIIITLHVSNSRMFTDQFFRVLTSDFAVLTRADIDFCNWFVSCLFLPCTNNMAAVSLQVSNLYFCPSVRESTSGRSYSHHVFFTSLLFSSSHSPFFFVFCLVTFPPSLSRTVAAMIFNGLVPMPDNSSSVSGVSACFHSSLSLSIAECFHRVKMKMKPKLTTF